MLTQSIAVDVAMVTVKQYIKIGSTIGQINHCIIDKLPRSPPSLPSLCQGDDVIYKIILHPILSLVLDVILLFCHLAGLASCCSHDHHWVRQAAP